MVTIDDLLKTFMFSTYNITENYDDYVTVKSLNSLYSNYCKDYGIEEIPIKQIKFMVFCNKNNLKLTISKDKRKLIVTGLKLKGGE